MFFEDTANEIRATFKFGNVRGKTGDYFRGKIKSKGKAISKIHGNYMGYIDFDGVRYYDVREKAAIHFPIYAKGTASLPSDSTKRSDTTTLQTGDVAAAQIAKEELEILQRHDAKLRETVRMRRANGGPKLKRWQGIIF